MPAYRDPESRQMIYPAQAFPGDLPQTLAYDGSGNLSTITVTDGTDTWTQTLTYTDGNLTGVSAWVKQ